MDPSPLSSPPSPSSSSSSDPLLSSPSESFPRAMQEVGDDVILNCSSDREVHLCRWKTPYLNTYIVGEGIYVERGRHGHSQCSCTFQ